jgi:hypothetical protein
VGADAEVAMPPFVEVTLHLDDLWERGG